MLTTKYFKEQIKQQKNGIREGFILQTGTIDNKKY
jgi:hypothetical protein